LYLPFQKQIFSKIAISPFVNCRSYMTLAEYTNYFVIFFKDILFFFKDFEKTSAFLLKL